MAGQRVGAVLCDVDGVLRVWGDLGAVDAAHGLPVGTVAGAAFREERLLPAVTGRVSDEEWRAAVADDLAAACGSLARARAVVADWGRQPFRVDAEVLALLGEARRRVPVLLVSNGTTRLEADLAALGLDTAVDGVLNSARLGAAKPDPQVYLAAAARAEVPPGQCLFVDDSAGNVAAAEALGMLGHHHRDAAGLRRALAAGGLLRPLREMRRHPARRRVSIGRMTTFSAHDGTTLSYEQLGDGAPLVAIPGGPGADARYLGSLGGLDADRRLIRFEPRGTGRSAAPVDRASCAFASQAKDLEALREHLGLDSFDLLGHSAGALTAQRYAAEFPHRVRSLVLVTPVGRGAREADEAELAAIRAGRADQPWYPDAAQAAALLAAGQGDPAELLARITPFFWGSWDDRARAASFDPDLVPGAPWMREAFYASAGEAAPVTVPVLVVAGELDGMIGTAPARLVAALHPGARLEVLAGAGHRPWVEKPEEFTALVREFLG